MKRRSGRSPECRRRKRLNSRLLPLGVEVLRSPDSTDPLDLKDALGFLSAKGITRLMVEGGPTLAAALIKADLVDEAVLFHSDKSHRPGRHRSA